MSLSFLRYLLIIFSGQSLKIMFYLIILITLWLLYAEGGGGDWSWRFWIASVLSIIKWEPCNWCTCMPYVFVVHMNILDKFKRNLISQVRSYIIIFLYDFLFKRGLDGRDHFYTILISLRRTAIYNVPIYWLWGRWQVYCSPRQQLFHETKLLSRGTINN